MNTTFEVRFTTGRTTLQTPTVWPSPTLTRHQHYWHRPNKVKIIYFLLAGTEGFHVRDEGPCRGPTTVALDKVEEKPGQHNGCLTDDWIRGLCTRETDRDRHTKQRWRQEADRRTGEAMETNTMTDMKVNKHQLWLATRTWNTFLIIYIYSCYYCA